MCINCDALALEENRVDLTEKPRALHTQKACEVWLVDHEADLTQSVTSLLFALPLISNWIQLDVTVTKMREVIAPESWRVYFPQSYFWYHTRSPLLAIRMNAGLYHFHIGYAFWINKLGPSFMYTLFGHKQKHGSNWMLTWLYLLNLQ